MEIELKKYIIHELFLLTKRWNELKLYSKYSKHIKLLWAAGYYPSYASWTGKL